MPLWPPQFVFAVCQHGAEAPLKADVARRWPQWRPAFSRPGYVTFKLPQPGENLEHSPNPSALARTTGWSLGRVSRDTLAEAVETVWTDDTVQTFLAACRLADIHVWQRDRALPGVDGFEPGPTPLSDEVRAAMGAAAPGDLAERLSSPNPTSQNQWVLDIALVEPNAWWLGAHFTTSRVSRWPGGAPEMKTPAEVVGRPYYKMVEALLWSALPISRGDEIVELGCAPGAAAQALLERGYYVIGIDPAEVAPVVAKHPHFAHVQKRARDVRMSEVQGASWLTADMNVPPEQTLDDVERLVRGRDMTIRGLILTLKLLDWDLLKSMPQWIRRIQSWGYRDVRLRQLAYNRREICLAATRSRGQRRMRRKRQARPISRRTGRVDGPHQ